MQNKLKRAYLFLILFLVVSVGISFAFDFSFAAASDSRGKNNGVNEPVLKALMEDLVQNHPSVKFILFPGDLINGSRKSVEKNLSQLKKWKEVMAPVYNSPHMVWPKVWVSIGNHETKVKDFAQYFLKMFPNVYMNGPKDELGFTYSFDYGNSHFVSVMTDRWLPKDPEDPYHSKTHYVGCLDWLEKDLAAARKRGIKHIFVFGHQPAFPVSTHIGDSLPNAGWILKHPNDPDRYKFMKMRDRFWDILVKYKVAAYICGHEHVYGRQSIRGVYQIVTGGAGAPLYDVNPTYDEPTRKHMPSWSPTKSYKTAKKYYKVLNYKYGKGETAQASNDFVGGRFFHYVVFNVGDDFVTVRTYGVEPKKGTKNQLPENCKIKLLDEFTINDVK